MSTTENNRHILAKADDGAHLLEECRLDRFHPVLAPVAAAESQPAGWTNVFLIALGIGGASRWYRHPRPGNEPPSPSAASGESAAGCILDRHQFAAFPAGPDLQVSRAGGPTGHFLVWRFRMDAMRAIRSVLGSGPPQPPAHPGTPGLAGQSWPIVGPLPMSAALRSLALSLRTPPAGPMQTLWYGAKLLELIALLAPPSASRLPDPRNDGTSSAHPRLHPAVQKAVGFIQDAFASPLTLAEIARAAGVSPTHLSHLFSTELGETLTSYLRRTRIEHAAQLIQSGDCNVTEAAMSVGYSSLGQFSQAFRARFGHSPGKHRRLLRN
ncbi:AraC family transcriptional regulator [Opitutaceae bacterium TAV5]|nr:AraC family transcriptional regulator [Opitutaceae bacterium TAV5]